MRHITLDGTLLEFGGVVGAELLIEESAWLVDPPDWSCSLQVSQPHVAELMLAGIMRGLVLAQGGLRSGLVIVGDASTEGMHDGTLIAWRGPYHCVFTVVPAGSCDLATALGFFNRFVLSDSPDGLVLISPEESARLLQRRMVLAAHRNGETSLTVRQISSDSLSVLPNGRGAQVAGGEIWQGQCDAEFSLNMLTPTAVCVIASESETAVLDVVEHLTVNWE